MRRRLTLHAGQDVAVEVERNADFAVAQALAGDFGVNAGCQHVGGMAMPEIVQPDALQAARLDELREATGTARLARARRRNFAVGAVRCLLAIFSYWGSGLEFRLWPELV